MPYIAVELDAKKHVPHVARAVALPEHQVGWGLVCLWEWCWSEKTDLVHAGHLAGFFAHDGERMAAALESFGFLERLAEGYRVRGAERYLRVSAQRSAAGKARASAPRTDKGTFAGSSAGAPLVPPLDSQPAASQRATSGQPALSPTTDDRRPTTELLKTAGPVGGLRDGIDAAFKAKRDAAYAWTFEDERAIGALFGKPDATEAEILRRWALCLEHVYPIWATVADLLKNWNACAKAQGPPPTVRKGVVNATDAEFAASAASTDPHPF